MYGQLESRMGRWVALQITPDGPEIELPARKAKGKHSSTVMTRRLEDASLPIWNLDTTPIEIQNGVMRSDTLIRRD